MKIEKSKKAPSFTSQNQFGEPVSLDDYKGKNIWLAFYRYASCPLCNLHLHSIIRRFDEVEKIGVVFLPVFQSPPAEVLKYTGDKPLPFPILCDPDETIYRLYDVKSSFWGFFSIQVLFTMIKAFLSGFFPGKMEGEIGRIPSEFLIDEEMNIFFEYKGKNIGDHPKLEVILEQISDAK